MRNTWLGIVAAAIVTASPVAAQNTGILAHAFEGTSVTLKMDMPASSQGVTVRPSAASPVDFPAVARAIKSSGIGVHRGESITVTKVVVKEHHIEFHLGGGGFGTFSDILNQSLQQAPTVPYEYKSRNEKDLESDLRWTWDPYDRRAIKDELHREQDARYRDNAMATAINAQNQALNQANERAQRAQSGSRFNITYSDGFPQGALTPEGVMRALSQYVDFDRPGMGGGGWTAPAPASGSPAPAPGLRKGLTVPQVEQMLGPASNVGQRTEGSIQETIREYQTQDGQRIVAQFVGGVLVNYSITPR